MSATDALKTFFVFASIMLAAWVVMQIIDTIHTLRLRVNRQAIADLSGVNAKLRAENAMLWSQVTANASQVYVNTKTIERLMDENDMLTKENKDLKDGTPIKDPIRVKRFKH